ncbi:MAG TPA: helix-turn-helix domain-containing protein [Kofleriaceae bacterium]
MARVRLAKIVRTLPRRAHELSRATVEQSQRWRLIEAMIEVAARIGYADASVATVIERAGVSRKTFYEHFTDKEDCFLAGYEVVSDRLIADIVAASAGHKSDAARRTAQVTKFIATLAAEPAGARVFMVDVLGAGPRALKLREQVNRRFADALFGDAPVDEIRRTAVVGGVNNVVAGALLAGRGKDLLELAPSLSDFVRSALR